MRPARPKRKKNNIVAAPGRRYYLRSTKRRSSHPSRPTELDAAGGAVPGGGAAPVNGPGRSVLAPPVLSGHSRESLESVPPVHAHIDCEWGLPSDGDELSEGSSGDGFPGRGRLLSKSPCSRSYPQLPPPAGVNSSFPTPLLADPTDFGDCEWGLPSDRDGDTGGSDDDADPPGAHAGWRPTASLRRDFRRLESFRFQPGAPTPSLSREPGYSASDPPFPAAHPRPPPHSLRRKGAVDLSSPPRCSLPFPRKLGATVPSPPPT